MLPLDQCEEALLAQMLSVLADQIGERGRASHPSPTDTRNTCGGRPPQLLARGQAGDLLAKKATQPGTWASLSPCKKSGPRNP